MQVCKRSEVYYADLDPTIGSEQGGIRPVLIIQNDYGNTFSPTTIVAPITSKGSRKKKLPTHVKLTDLPWMKQESMVLLEQIIRIDKIRLKKYLGVISKEQELKVNKAIKISLDLE